MHARRSFGRQLTLVALGCAGCNAILGLEDGILEKDRCEPLAISECYSGPQGTKGVGACLAGRRQCNAEGDGYGPCEGEVTPAPEVCGNAVDDDCDGQVDEPDDGAPASAAGGGERCACAPGSTEACPYTGPPGTEGVGVCRAGERVCGSDGRWGPCDGEITPRAEDCATRDDEACDGDEDCGATLPGGGLLGGPGLEEGRALALDGRGGLLVGGEFEGKLELGAAQIASGAERDVFVARLDGSGAATWVRRLVDEGTGRLTAMSAAPDGSVAVAGELEGLMASAGLVSTEAQGFVVKLDAVGSVLWGAPLSGSPTGVVMSTAGEVVVASAVDDATGKSDVEVAKFGAAGLPLWSKRLGGAGEQAPGGVAMDAVGNVVVVGSFEHAIELGEGGPELRARGKSDVFLVKLDRHGGLLDGLSFGDEDDQRGTGVAVGPSGEIALSGTLRGFLDLNGGVLFASEVSAFVAELGPSGEYRFSRTLETHTPPRVALDAGGGVVIAGDVMGPLNLGGGPLGGAGRGHDVYVARYDPLGRHVWSRRFGPGPGRPDPDGAGRWAADVAIDTARGDVLIVGTVEGSIDVEGVATTSNDRDLLLLRLAY